MKKYCIIIFNPLEVPHQGFSKILNLIFKQNVQEIQLFLQGNPSFWKSQEYNVEIAQAFRHKLIRYSNLLGLDLVLKLELCNE